MTTPATFDEVNVGSNLIIIHLDILVYVLFTLHYIRYMDVLHQSQSTNRLPLVIIRLINIFY